MIKDNLISILQIAPALIFAGFVIYVMVFPLRTLEYTDKQLGVGSSSFAPGESIPLNISYCKYTELTETVEGQLISQDTDRISKPMLTVNNEAVFQRNLQPGCHRINSKIWKVPSDTIEGHTYVAYFTVTYIPNAFRKITVHSTSAPFMVQGGK